jgi:DeoR/GlpR family transcriptional regulator of sugar metabolism
MEESMNTSDQVILELIQSGDVLSVDELADRSGFSKPTVYRSLGRLQSEGLITRLTPGIALPKEIEVSFSHRLGANTEKKQEIGAKAIRLVEDEDTIFIDASTTCLALARELAKSGLSRVSIVTNSTVVVNELMSRAGDFYVMCTGGEIQPGLGALVGPLACSFIGKMNFQKAFVSGAAFSLGTGLMTTQASLVELLRAASQSASETIVLLDSTKFQKEALLNVFDFGVISTVITDSEVPSSVRRALEAGGIRVV